MKKVILILTAILLVGSIGFVGFGATDANAAYIIKGDSKQNITAVQQRLADLKFYKIKVDGVWGSSTRQAVISFQRSRNLKADGIVGSATEKALGVKLTASGSSSSANSNDVTLLARCIHAEARGEPYVGQVAVGAIVLNRIRSSEFPNTMSGVIYQPWAFTAVNDGQINLTPNASSFKAARDALSGWDPSNGCLFYYNPSTATSKWIFSLVVELRIGKHAFARK